MTTRILFGLGDDPPDVSMIWVEQCKGGAGAEHPAVLYLASVQFAACADGREAVTSGHCPACATPTPRGPWSGEEGELRIPFTARENRVEHDDITPTVLRLDESTTDCLLRALAIQTLLTPAWRALTSEIAGRIAPDGARLVEEHCALFDNVRPQFEALSEAWQSPGAPPRPGVLRLDESTVDVVMRALAIQLMVAPGWDHVTREIADACWPEGSGRVDRFLELFQDLRPEFDALADAWVRRALEPVRHVPGGSTDGEGGT